jgi:hypothetical protein
LWQAITVSGSRDLDVLRVEINSDHAFDVVSVHKLQSTACGTTEKCDASRFMLGQGSGENGVEKFTLSDVGV